MSGYFLLNAAMYSSATPFTVGAKPHHVMLPEVAEDVSSEVGESPQAAVSPTNALTRPASTAVRSRRFGEYMVSSISGCHPWAPPSLTRRPARGAEPPER